MHSTVTFCDNPNFQHCNLNYIAVPLGGQQVPWAPLQPLFSGSSYIRAFYTELLGGGGYIVILGTQLDESSLSTDTPCTVSILLQI